MTMPVQDVILAAVGAMLSLWSGYQLFRAFRIGEITAVGEGLPLRASVDDPPAWFWFIVLLDASFFLIGLSFIVGAIT